LRLAAQVVPALVGHDDTKSGGSERLDLFAPPIPKFRESMQKNNRGSIFRSSGYGVQPDTSVLKVNAFQRAGLAEDSIS
jgi:hypothetical protein